jgi:LmbE family N-acetylglucosaminyl deacetylase
VTRGNWRVLPNLVVDSTEHMDLKLRAIACHASQVRDATAVEARVRDRAAALGTSQGFSYAEGFEHIVLPA